MPTSRSRLVRASYLGLGLVSLGLGIAGIVLPLVPTTPLILLAAFCFARSSDRLTEWLIGHPRFGAMIRAYRDGQGITPRAKWSSVAAIVVTFGITLTFFVRAPVARAGLVLIAVAVTTYILTRPTCRG